MTAPGDVAARVEELARDLCFAPEDFSLSRKYAEAYAADLRALLAAVEDGRADRERIDWLENPLECYWFQGQSQPHGNIFANGRGPGLRLAIDAARRGATP